MLLFLLLFRKFQKRVVCVSMHIKNIYPNHASWFSSIKFISNKIAQSLDLKNNKISSAILNKFFINEWNKNKEKFSDGKLSTYLTVKNNFGFEKYLDKIKNFEQRRTLTRFRISAHKLAIETGRYKGIPRHDRICTRCTDCACPREQTFSPKLFKNFWISTASIGKPTIFTTTNTNRLHIYQEDSYLSDI